MNITRKVAYPAGAVEMSVHLWQWNGHRLMTHRPARWSPEGLFRVSEETTGYGIPGTFADSETDAEAQAMKVLAAKGDRLPQLLATLPTLNPI